MLMAASGQWRTHNLHAVHFSFEMIGLKDLHVPVLFSFWLPGFLFLAWAVFGFVVEYLLGIQWRTPPNWPVLVPYVLLYLGTVMFYWWPVAQLVRPLWFLYAVFFALETYLNVTSH